MMAEYTVGSSSRVGCIYIEDGENGLKKRSHLALLCGAEIADEVGSSRYKYIYETKNWDRMYAAPTYQQVAPSRV
jgi:hypothetical protein